MAGGSSTRVQPTVEMTAFGAHAFDAYSGRYGPTVAYLVVTGPEKIPQAGRRMGFGSVVDVLGATGRLPGHLQLFFGLPLAEGFDS